MSVLCGNPLDAVDFDGGRVLLRALEGQLPVWRERPEVPQQSGSSAILERSVGIASSSSGIRMTEAQIKEAMDRAWRELPPDGALSDADRQKFWQAIESIIPYLPGDSRNAGQTTGEP